VTSLFHPSVSGHPSATGRDAQQQTLGLGTAPLGSLPDGPLWWGPQDRDVAVATVVAAIEAGVAFIDTAPFYGWGRAEEIVGDAIRDLPTRPPLLTKCGTVPDPNARSTEDHRRDAIRADIDASRSRLGVDILDAVQVHDPDPATPIEATWEALMELVEGGAIAVAGLSNHSIELMERALSVGPIGVVQHQYSLLVRDVVTDGVLDWCADHGIPFLAWSPLASGFLVDDFDLAATHATDLRRRLRWATAEQARTELVRSALQTLAEQHDTTMVAVALGWVTRRPGVYAIVGARTPAEAELLGRPLPPLTEEDLQLLDQAGSA
jgi:aryl-alcohol dehydrogenase-like predicted oxidoreductase